MVDHRIVRSMVIALGSALALSMPLAAQEGPPIGGLTGTIALDGTVDREYAGAKTVILKTLDGVRHVFRFSKAPSGQGGTGTGLDDLQGLHAGTTVSVHYAVTENQTSAQNDDLIADDLLVVNEGTVIGIDHTHRQITIRFDDKNTETFQLSDRAAADTSGDLQELRQRVTGTLYYNDEPGHTVARLFKSAE